MRTANEKGYALKKSYLDVEIEHINQWLIKVCTILQARRSA